MISFETIPTSNTLTMLKLKMTNVRMQIKALKEEILVFLNLNAIWIKRTFHQTEQETKQANNELNKWTAFLVMKTPNDDGSCHGNPRTVPATVKAQRRVLDKRIQNTSDSFQTEIAPT